MVVLCFDLDDTICDSHKSAEASRRAIIHYIADGGVILSKVKTVYDSLWKEFDAKKYVELIFEHGYGEREIRGMHIEMVLKAIDRYDPQIIEELKEISWRVASENLIPYPDTHQVLTTLKKKYSLSLLTNGPSDSQREKIRVLGLAKYFDHIVVSGEEGYSKPNPEIFNILAKRVGIPTHEIIYIGNNYEKDVIGAKNAGLRAIWINRENEAIEGPVKPDHEVKSLPELLDILQPFKL
ncbi:MAG: HAD family hydrolase [Candidatus Bathyarchaeota archaeon]|nr:HAD family hydrolase [Candidatus Bathyarchaeota archaeon]